MIWGLLGLFLAVYGFFSNSETFLIAVGILFLVIGIRRTVFNYEKIGTFVNFIALFLAIALGVFVYFFDGDTNKQEVAKASVPKALPRQQPIAKAPTPKPTTEPTQAPPQKQESTLETYVRGMKCAKQEDLNNIEVGRNVRGVDLLLCPNFQKITIPYRAGYEMASNTLSLDENFSLQRITPPVNREFLPDSMVLLPTENKLTNGFIFYQILDKKTWEHQMYERKAMFTPLNTLSEWDGGRNELETLMFNMKCAEPSDFSRVVLGKGGVKDVYMKLCRGFKPIKILLTPNFIAGTTTTFFDRDHYEVRVDYGTEIIKTDYVKDAYIFSPIPNIEREYPNIEYVLVNLGG